LLLAREALILELQWKLLGALLLKVVHSLFVAQKSVQYSRYGSRALNNMIRDIPRARNLTVQTGMFPSM